MHHAAQITNGMLYDLIMEMKGDMNRRFDEVDKKFADVDKKFTDVDRRFDEVDKKFTEIYRRFDEVDKRFDMNERRIESLEDEVKDVGKKLNELVYERDKIKITFSRTFAGGTMFFSGLIAFIVAMLGRN